MRHAESTANQLGVLAGRLPGNPLSTRGRKQSLRIAKFLATTEIQAIYSSPISRCLETIEPLCIEQRRRVKKDLDFQEMDYGSWSGRKLSELRHERLWKKIQKSPMEVTFPEGESFTQAASRLKRGLNRISKNHRKGNVLLVSHGDPIKMILQMTLGGDLNHFQRIVIDPASLSVIEWPERVLLATNIPTTLGKVRGVLLNRNNGLKNRRVLGGGNHGTAGI